MKKMMILMLLIVSAVQLNAQDIQITRFERNYTSLIASANPVYDNTGEACAVLRFFVRDANFIIEPNLGMMKQEMLPGEIRLYVPKGTKRLTVRNKNWMPLTGYVIPVTIEPKVTYDVEMSITEEALNRNKANKGHNVYASLGYNITSISGPSIALGFAIKHHNIELGAIYGVNKTDDLYFYNSTSNATAAYSYQVVRIFMKYGYDFKVTDFFSVMPQVGAGYNLYHGKEIIKGSDYGSAHSMVLTGGVRLIASFNNRFKLHVTPEYGFGVYKDNNCKTVSYYDKTFNSWTDGFNVNVGLIYFF